MRAPRFVLVAIAVAVLAAAPEALAASGDGDAAAVAALRRLAEEDVVGARELLAPHEPLEKGDASVKLAGGVLRFFEQRYGEAVALLEASGAGNAGGYLELARAAQDVTKNHARFEADHFVISYPKGKDEVLVPYLVEALGRQREALRAALGSAPEDDLVVEVVDDVKGLARVSTLSEAQVRTSGTVAVAKFNKLMLLSPKALLKGYDWLDTAAHEYTHHVVTRITRNRAPIWLQEGLAKWFESAWRGRTEPLSPYAGALVKDAIGRNALVTFEEMHPSLAKLPSQERAALAYAQVVLAVEWLVKQAGPSSLGRVTAALGQGKSTEAAVADAAGMPFSRFLVEWKRYLVARPLPRGGEHELGRLRFKDDPKQAGGHAEWAEISDGAARGYARLGEIFRARGRWNAARLEYGRAYQRVGARVPVLSGRYATAAIESGQRGEAEKVLSEALSWNPDYPALNLGLARLLADRQEWPRARDHLLAANRQDPFDPEIHARLARVMEALGDGATASRESRFAALLGGRGEGHP